MADTVYDKIYDYLASLPMSNQICSELGTTLAHSNLFIGYEPNTDSDSVTIIPYAGASPEPDGWRQNPSVQIRLKTSSREKALRVQQAVINDFHMRSIDNKIKLFANNSAPTIMPDISGGEWKVTVSNYRIKNIKIT